jgi:hypothetical protein
MLISAGTGGAGLALTGWLFGSVPVVGSLTMLLSCPGGRGNALTGDPGLSGVEMSG